MKRYQNLPPLDERTLLSLYEAPTPDGYDKHYVDPLFLDHEAIEVPDGPWHVTDHPNRDDAPHAAVYTADNPPDPAQQVWWRQLGLELDSIGRPLYPYASQFVTNKLVGMVTGPGMFWNYGPNETVRVVLGRQHHPRVPVEVLVIEDEDGDARLPGMFLPESLTHLGAAFSLLEAKAELDLELLDGRAVCAMPYALPDRRNTLHAWNEEGVVTVMKPNQGYLYDHQLNPPAMWASIENLQEMEVKGRFPRNHLGSMQIASNFH